MAKLTKHAEVLNQLHAIVTKQAAEEAQKTITGVPGEDTKPESIKDEHETTNKNAVKPENNPQGYSQKGSDDPSEPVASPKTAAELGAEIMDIIRKQAEVQDSVTGVPGKDTHPESIKDEHEKVDKNAVKPEKLKPQAHEQKPSSDKSEPVASAKKASDDEVRDMAAKVASYELGRQFCTALLKVAAESGPSESELMKEAGRRDFDVLIAEAADRLEKGATSNELTEKQAEDQGAAYFDALVKQAALEQSFAENEFLKAKLAEYENAWATAQNEKQAADRLAADQNAQIKLAETVAAAVIERLKNTPQE